LDEERIGGDEGPLLLSRVMSAPAVKRASGRIMGNATLFPRYLSDDPSSIHAKPLLYQSAPKETATNQARRRDFLGFQDVSLRLCHTEGLRRSPVPKGRRFIGRKNDIAHLAKALLQHRIVWLRGSHHGVGTSAVATATGLYLRQRKVFPDGIVVIDARGIQEVEALMRLITHTLAPLVPTRTRDNYDFRGLAATLRSFKILVVLEHVENLCIYHPRQFRYFVGKLQNCTEHMCLLFTSHMPAPPETDNPTIVAREGVEVVDLFPLSPSDAALLLLDRCQRELSLKEVLSYLQGGSYASLSNIGDSCESREKESRLIVALAKHPLISGLKYNPLSLTVAAQICERKSLREWDAILTEVQVRRNWSRAKRGELSQNGWGVVHRGSRRSSRSKRQVAQSKAGAEARRDADRTARVYKSPTISDIARLEKASRKSTTNSRVTFSASAVDLTSLASSRHVIDDKLHRVAQYHRKRRQQSKKAKTPGKRYGKYASFDGRMLTAMEAAQYHRHSQHEYATSSSPPAAASFTRSGNVGSTGGSPTHLGRHEIKVHDLVDKIGRLQEYLGGLHGEQNDFGETAERRNMIRDVEKGLRQLEHDLNKTRSKMERKEKQVKTRKKFSKRNSSSRNMKDDQF